MSKLRLLLARLPWLYCGGSVLIFASWAFQNFLEAQWRDKLAALDRSQAALSANEALSNYWFGIMRAALEDSTKEGLVADAAVNYVNFTATSLAIALTRTAVTDSAKRRVASGRQAFVDSAVASHQRGEFDALAHRAIGIRQIEEAVNQELVSEADSLYKETAQRAADYNRCFLMCYVLGAALIAVAFVRSKWPPES